MTDPGAHRRGRHHRHGLDATWHWLIVNLRELLAWLTARPTVVVTNPVDGGCI